MIDADARQEARTLRRAVARLQRSFRSTRDPDGPTPAQLSALGTLYREGALATGELAERERLKPQSVTRLVAGLVERGLIERVIDANDRRRLLVAVTPEGRRQLARELERRDERLVRQLARLSAHDRALVNAACAVIERLAESG